MTIGEPVMAVSYKYQINADHVNGDTMVIDITRMDFGNPEDVDEPIQDLVDMINADPRWTLTGAQKLLTGQAEITPTPPE